MKCCGFQYELGKTAEVEGDIELCEKGLHACEMPLDVLGHYAPGDGSRYFEAELEDVSGEIRSDDTKRVGKKLTLSAEIGIPGLVKAQVEYVKSQCDFEDAIIRANAEKENLATGDSGAASATGASGAASATGVRGAASATGWSGAASATGDSGAASATGDGGAASATGVSGAASATGKGCVAMTTGYCGRVMGEIGNALVCVERDNEGTILHILSGVVDGTMLKPNVWYTVNGGEWEEVPE